MEHKFEIWEIAIVNCSGHVTHNCECEIIEIGDVYSNLNEKSDYKIKVPGVFHDETGEYWTIDEDNLRKKKPPQESDDICETREFGSPSFNEMMEDLKSNKPIPVNNV